MKRLYTHAKQRCGSQAQESLLTRSWSICNPATTSSLYKQLTLETFHHAADTSGGAASHANPHHLPDSCSVTLEGESFIKARQQNFNDLRVRGNRLVIYNQIMQPPKGITVEDTDLARLAFKLTDADENR
jgi:hypothetical protein